MSFVWENGEIPLQPRYCVSIVSAVDESETKKEPTLGRLRGKEIPQNSFHEVFIFYNTGFAFKGKRLKSVAAPLL
jgi:hypothetical protein